MYASHCTSSYKSGSGTGVQQTHKHTKQHQKDIGLIYKQLTVLWGDTNANTYVKAAHEGVSLWS